MPKFYRLKVAMKILINGIVYDLHNSVLFDSENQFRTIIFELNGKVMLMSNTKMSSNGKPIPGGIMVLKKKATNVRINGELFSIEIPEVSWKLMHLYGKEGICPICLLPFQDEDIWQCTGCGVMVHDSNFCRPLSPDEPCFKCKG